MKPDKRQLATLHDMETWAYKVKKDAKEWKRNVENVFHVEVFWIITNCCKSAHNKKCPKLNGTKKCNSKKWEI